ncbi:A disintegrin and metalloproteinase with thrombospondin motifs adt-2 [Phlebotomus argentipes]|uniref:A disintegrin and metalloproteinase with thrombospondin motifs adt-2 n=1 Tax=Phlebotomus argentipes TaxID=94469 RepID=UPI0028932899|nr:A disintegrin and metalloproteinase with thrombospondin motifs adt-2 [Phlebotomus argentipes]
MLENVTDCFYANSQTALDVCDDNLRGVVRHKNQDFVIHPLPERFGSGTHLLIPRNRVDIRATERGFFDVELMKDDFQQDVHERNKRYIASKVATPSVLHIETAIFVDRDLFRHMAKNYPKNTEMNLIRFVLAMVNGVQLLYHHPSLGYQVNFVLKRLEILHNDPKDLHRSSDIDVFLNSFCMWQRKFNPAADTDVMHFDHAVILTGLDLYVVGKNGKISSQVVGLAPVAGMCTPTSSCTINEGKHFESVFVVAHEIGHNLGMRHDTSENNCDPSLYIMSPTLGSGKITWSKCSKEYLSKFLESTQAHCLFDRGHSAHSLDHAAEGLLPGERFDADQQCMLKYGKDSVRSRTQPLTDVCRDLHCQRDRYTWTSHPALEGTFCGEGMWCKSGVCKLKATTAYLESHTPYHRPMKHFPEKSANFIEGQKLGHYKQDFGKSVTGWSEWSAQSECESGCLYGESGRLKEGSIGLKVSTRTCLDMRVNRKKCFDLNKRYEACTAKQCFNIPRTTVMEFANQICERAKEFDSDILGVGIQQVALNPDDSCRVFCKTRSGMPKTKNWMFPDGTTCRNVESDFDDAFYCINGRCQKFSCDNSTSNLYKIDPSYCPQSQVRETDSQSNASAPRVEEEKIRDKQNPTQNTNESQQVEVNESYNGEVAPESSFIKAQIYNNWRLRNSEKQLMTANHHPSLMYQNSALRNDLWQIKSGCYFSCMDMAKGIQIVASTLSAVTNIQLCSPEAFPCEHIQTTYDFSSKLCSRYKMKVRGLSGNGMQISPSVEDPDRSCKVACQDEYIGHRFYLVNGEQGYFPFGTRCSKTEKRFCVRGRCLEFGPDNMPLRESHSNLALFQHQKRRRRKRSFMNFTPVNITERISQELLDKLLNNFNISMTFDPPADVAEKQIDMTSPIYLSDSF